MSSGYNNRSSLLQHMINEIIILSRCLFTRTINQLLHMSSRPTPASYMITLASLHVPRHHLFRPLPPVALPRSLHRCKAHTCPLLPHAFFFHHNLNRRLETASR